MGYSYGPVYVGIGYLAHEMAPEVTEMLLLQDDGVSVEKVITSQDQGRRDYIGLGASLNVTDDLYFAVTYQSVQYDMGPDRDTLDLVGSYSFGTGYTLTAGMFTYDPNTDTSDPDHLGYNLTLIKSLNDNVRVFAEWLRYDFQDDSGSPGETVDHLSLGLRIAFSAKVL